MTKLFNEKDIKAFYRKCKETMNKQDAGFETLQKSGLGAIKTSLIIADANRWEYI